MSWARGRVTERRKLRSPCKPASKIGPNCRRLAWATLMGEPAAFWPRGGAWSTGPPHFHPLDATGSTAQASRRRFGPTLETGQQGLLTFIFRAPCSPRWHCFEEVRFWGAIPHLVLGWASRRRPPRWEWLLYWGMTISDVDWDTWGFGDVWDGLFIDAN